MKKRIDPRLWEATMNIVSIREQENRYLDVLIADSLQTMEDSDIDENMIIRLMTDGAYYGRIRK